MTQTGTTTKTTPLYSTALREREDPRHTLHTHTHTQTQTQRSCLGPIVIPQQRTHQTRVREQ